MIELVGSLKILVTQQYEDAYLRSYQADDDDDGGGGGQTSAPSMGRKRR
jgi:hypothetical protein